LGFFKHNPDFRGVARNPTASRQKELGNGAVKSKKYAEVPTAVDG